MTIEVEVVIAEIHISFSTNHLSDAACLNDIFLYHTVGNREGFELKICHNVIIMSSKERLNSFIDKPLIWSGYINGSIPIKWYNPVDEDENLIFIGKDILIKHLPKRKLTDCCLAESKGRFFKSHRPQLTNYIFFLIHSITSMHEKYSLHASCVAKDGYAYLFLGKSGEGKTTISDILGKAGWEYMGDDLVFISQNEQGEIFIDAFLSKIKLLNTKFQTKDAVDVIKDKKFKYLYKQKLGAILKLQQMPEKKESILFPASQAETFAWLMNSSNNIKIQYHQQQWMELCEKASSLPAYTLMFANKEYFNPAILDTVLK
jgi:hypothetical protein